MKRFFIDKILEVIFSIISICWVFFVMLMLYIGVNNGGYFCEYCSKSGIYHQRFEAEQEIGKNPCEKSKTGKHKVKYFFADPKSTNKNKPQYIE